MNKEFTITIAFKQSLDSGKFVGYIKEYPEAISKGINEIGLVKNLFDTMFAIMEAKKLNNESNRTEI